MNTLAKLPRSTCRCDAVWATSSIALGGYCCSSCPSWSSGRRRSITSNLVLEWAVLADQGPARVLGQPSLGGPALRAVSARATDPRTEVPALGLLRARYQRKRPYLYSEEEITRLMGAAARLASPTGLRAQTYSTLLGLLAVAGLKDQRGDRP